MAFVQASTYYWTLSNTVDTIGLVHEDLISSLDLSPTHPTIETKATDGPVDGYTKIVTGKLGVIDSGLSFDGDATIACKIRHVDITGDTDRYIIHKNDEYSIIYNAGVGVVTFTVGNVSVSEVLNAIDLQDWILIVASFNNTTKELRLTIQDRTSSIVDSTIIYIANVEPLEIGEGFTNLNIAELSFTNGILTADECLFLLNSPVRYPYETVYIRDVLGVTDSIHIRSPIYIEVSDSLATSEDSAQTSDTQIIIDDVEVDESYTQNLEKQFQRVDVITIRDAYEQHGTIYVEVTDEVLVLENQTVNGMIIREVSDTVHIDDYANRTYEFDVTDSVGTSDEAENQKRQDVTDTVGVSENVSYTSGPHKKDTITILEHIVIKFSKKLSIVDAVTVADKVAGYKNNPTKRYDTL